MPAVPAKTDIDVDVSNVHTFEEACEAMRQLQDDAGDALSTIRKAGERLIIARFKQGVVAHRALDMSRNGKYGKGIVKELARSAGMHRTTIYKAKDFAEALPFGDNVNQLRQWLENKREEKGRNVSWTYCINWSKKKLKGETQDQQKQLDDSKGDLLEKANKLERTADDLEQEAKDLADHVTSRNVEEADEARGVAHKAREVAHDMRRQMQRVGLKGAARLESKEYLEHVRSYSCIVCSDPNVDAHHITTGGMGTKGHDIFTLPLCREHHSDLHQFGQRFQDEHNINLWKHTAYIIAEFFTGADLT